MTSLKTPTEPTLSWIQQLREKIYRETKGMSHEEFNEYIHQGGESFRQEMSKRHSANHPSDERVG